MITRDNYENYFLLYTDDELSAAERRNVEAFAAANADLGRELEMLKALKLPAEELLFSEKSSLYRAVPIDAVLQEQLLLKLDDEFPAGADASLLNSSVAEREFALLLQTKLDKNDHIPFPGKSVLYKKEKDRVIGGAFWRWAAAAALLAFGIFIGMSLLKKTNTAQTEQGLASAERTHLLPTIKTAPLEKDTAVTTVTQKDPAQYAIVNPRQNAEDTRHGVRQNIRSTRITIENSSHNVTPALIAQQEPAPANNDKLSIPEVSEKQVAVLLKPVSERNESAIVKPLPKIETAAEDNVFSPENAYAHTAVLDENDKSENKILYIDEDDLKRSKAGGIFRKVKRLVERTARIKSGSTLRIAGFAIAAN